MKKGAVALILAILALFLLSNYAKAPEKEVGEFGYINFVYDGDTFRVRTDSGELKIVRIIGADSPEVQSKYENLECFGNEASNFAKKEFIGKRVELIRDPLTDDKDRYNRYLRYLRLETGDYISQILIKEGYAKVYEFSAFTQKENFKTLELFAKDQNLGLWLECAK